MKTAVIYARYSCERQTEQSIEGQIRECTEFAKYNDITIVDTYIDRATTGTNDNRAAFQQLLKDCTKQAWDIVLVYKLDRFSRNKYEMAIHRKTLRDNSIKLISAKENIPDSPEGIILESLLEGMAEYYSIELAQKIRRGQHESRLKGHYIGGGVPYGYNIENKKFVINKDQAPIVLSIYEDYIAGKRCQEIADDLNDKGIPYRKNSIFTANTIYRILRNPHYGGVYTHKTDGTFYNTFPQIVPKHTMDLAVEFIKNNRFGKHPIEKPYILRGKIVCGICGHPFAGESGTSQNGKLVRYYKCLQRKKYNKCKNIAIRKELLEQAIIDTTISFLQNNSNMELLIDKIVEIHNNNIADESTTNILLAEKSQIKKSLDNLVAAVEQGIITSTTKCRIEELEAKLETINEQIKLEQSKQALQITRADIKKFFNKTLQKGAKAIIRLLINKIVFYPSRIEIYYNYTDKIRPDDDCHRVFLFKSEIKEFETENRNYRNNKQLRKLKFEMYI